MLEKAGVPPPDSQWSIRMAIRCAENIARHWVWEHRERGRDRGRVSFPGDSSIPQVLLPVALWLGTREYSGVWLHGGGGRFGEHEVFGFLGDERMVTLCDAMRVYGGGGLGRLSMAWYRNQFVHWAINFLHFWSQNRGEFILGRSRPGQEMSWCGREGCPYPYVTVSQIGSAEHAYLDQDVAKESREALAP